MCLLVKRVEFEAVRPVDEVRCKGSPLGWCLGAPLQWPKWVWWVHLPLEGVQVPKLAKSKDRFSIKVRKKVRKKVAAPINGMAQVARLVIVVP